MAKKIKKTTNAPKNSVSKNTNNLNKKGRGRPKIDKRQQKIDELFKRIDKVKRKIRYVKKKYKKAPEQTVKKNWYLFVKNETSKFFKENNLPLKKGEFNLAVSEFYSSLKQRFQYGSATWLNAMNQIDVLLKAFFITGFRTAELTEFEFYNLSQNTSRLPFLYNVYVNASDLLTDSYPLDYDGRAGGILSWFETSGAKKECREKYNNSPVAFFIMLGYRNEELEREMFFLNLVAGDDPRLITYGVQEWFDYFTKELGLAVDDMLMAGEVVPKEKSIIIDAQSVQLPKDIKVKEEPKPKIEKPSKPEQPTKQPIEQPTTEKESNEIKLEREKQKTIEKQIELEKAQKETISTRLEYIKELKSLGFSASEIKEMIKNT